MSYATVLRLTVSLLAFVLSFGSSAAESCADVRISVHSAISHSRSQLAADLAKTLHRSVIGEFLYSEGDTISIPEIEAGTLLDFTNALGSGKAVQCVIEDQVIHLVEPGVLNRKENALNHVFGFFAVPSIADLFVLDFRGRLRREAFDPRGDWVGGPGGGAYSNEAENYRLTPERLTNISARDLLFREGKTRPIVFTMEIQPASNGDLEGAWKKTEESMHFSVLR